MKKAVLILVKFALTAGIVGVLASRLDLKSLSTVLRAVPNSTLVLAALLVFAQPLIAAMRWHMIMRYLGVAVRLPQTLQVFWLGQFATVLLPSGLAGDGVRMWTMTQIGMRPAQSINSVVLDRVMALAGLALVVAATLPFVGDRIAAAPLRMAIAAVLAAGTTAGFVAGLRLRLPARWRDFRIMRALSGLLNDLRTISVPPWRLAVLAALSAFAILLSGLVVYVLVRSLGVTVGLFECLSLVPLVVLVTALPLSLGGWGLREGSMVGLLGMAGVPLEASFLTSIVIGLLTTAISVPGAIVWLKYWHARKPLPPREPGGEPSYTSAPGAQA